MALDNNLDGSNDIAQFLEKFKETPFPKETPQQEELPLQTAAPAAPVRPAQYARSFEKLEQKIHELEEKFEASTTQNNLILNELARTREAMERQKDKDAFLEHLSRTIATLRTSVENLSQAQQTQSFALREAPVQRTFDPLPSVFAPVDTVEQEAAYAAAQETARLRRERDEQTRLFNSLRQKASQLKAVNTALDREIRKAQEEKLEALKKSADQAKEILSLRDQLNAAEERFKSFDFEGRIISIKREYQQKVSRLETQLKEMSDTCMKQVEEIESLKAENTRLQEAVAAKEALAEQLAGKEEELTTLQNTISTLRSENSTRSNRQLAAFTAQLRTLEEQRDRLAIELEQSQIALETQRREKDLLEKNFQELVIKINHNDAVIGQLRQKIDVLGQQNIQLSQHNEELAQTNAALSQDNKTLNQTNSALLRRNAALSKHNSRLAIRNSSLTRQAPVSQEDITLEKAPSQDVVASPAAPQENTVAQQEYKVKAPLGKPLRRSSAALLAARLVEQHAQKEAAKREQEEKSIPLSSTSEELVSSTQALHRPEAPVLHSLGRTVAASAPAEEEWEVIRHQTQDQTQPPQPQAAAVQEEPQPEKQPVVQSEEDLPEIKVADPVPVHEAYDGEDFLEKTDSFIGRMKWSIFRENR